MTTDPPSADQVLAWLEVIQKDLAAIKEKVAPLIAEQRRLESREALLRDLLLSFGDDNQGSVRDSARFAESPSAPYQPGAPVNVGDYVTEKATEILRDSGRALHINELHAEFVKRGLAVPGAGKPVNLTVHLRRAKNITSPARGMYALGAQVEPLPRKKKRARHRRRKARRPAHAQK